MIGVHRHGRAPAPTLTGLLLSAAALSPALALDMTDMVVDSISAHPEVKEKIHVYRQIAGDRQIARGGWRPSVDLEASTGLYDTESPATGNASVDYDSSRVEFSVTQNLFDGYDTTHQIVQADARAEAALFDVYDTADNIALRAIQAYLEVIKQRRLLRLAEENVAAHEDILAQIRERTMSGVGRRSQLQQTEGRLARAQASLIAQQNNLEDSATQLHQILGRYVNPEALAEPRLPALPADDLDQLIEQALAEHPAMRVADGNIRAARADHRRSLRSRYPNVDLRFATEYGDDIGGLSGTTEETSLVLSLNYNLYRGGRNAAEQQKKIGAIYEQKEFAARVRRQVINTLRLSWVADTSLARQLEFLRIHVDKAGETVASYREEFFIGQRDLIDLLDAENERNSAQSQYAEAYYQSLGARYRVYEGLGRLLEAADVVVALERDQLRVARLETAAVDRLPLPVDEDDDGRRDPLDQCDNSLLGLEVNRYGCHQPAPISRLEPEPPPANSPPEPGDDRFEVESNGVLVITPAQLLGNDRDADADPLAIVEVGEPGIGQLAFSGEGNLVFRPAEGFVGEDRFEYAVSDNRDASPAVAATVTIRVREPDAISLDKVQLVNFKFNAAELTDLSKRKVEAIIERIKFADNIAIEIYAYTDDIGSAAYNEALSVRRAEAMRELLISNGISPTQISAFGMGEENPIADNSTPAGQAINRRGEFVFRVVDSVE